MTSMVASSARSSLEEFPRETREVVLPLGARQLFRGAHAATMGTGADAASLSRGIRGRNHGGNSDSSAPTFSAGRAVATVEAMGHIIDRCDVIDVLEESARLHRRVLVTLKHGHHFVDETRAVETTPEASGLSFATTIASWSTTSPPPAPPNRPRTATAASSTRGATNRALRRCRSGPRGPRAGGRSRSGRRRLR